MTDRAGTFAALEEWRGTAFLLGGLLMVVDAILVAATIGTGTEAYLRLGQAFVGIAWTAALLGLLGLYPGLADRSRWLSRAGVAFAVVGVVVFAAMAATSLVYYAGLPAGKYSDVGQYFIPGVLVGSVLGFLTFSLAGRWTGVHSRTVTALLLLPPVLVVTNIVRFVAGFEATTITFAIVVGDALAMLALGYVPRGDRPATARGDPTTDSTPR